jgi:ABC-type transporter Mla MlaB component
MVLRITRDEELSLGVTFKLEGRLVERYTTLLEDESRTALAAAGAVVLDLSGIAVIDRAGIEALQRLDRAGVTIVGCSELLASILVAEGIALTDRR